MRAMGRTFRTLRPGWVVNRVDGRGETNWEIVRFVDHDSREVPAMKWGKFYAVVRHTSFGFERILAGTTLYSSYQIVSRGDPSSPEPPIVRTVHREG